MRTKAELQSLLDKKDEMMCEVSGGKQSYYMVLRVDVRERAREAVTDRLSVPTRN